MEVVRGGALGVGVPENGTDMVRFDINHAVPILQ